MRKKSEEPSKPKLVEHRIFAPSMLIMIAICIPFAMYQDESLELLNSIFNQVVEIFNWGYLWYAIIMVILGFYMSFSKYGDVVLGDPMEKPRFTLFEYASILIAMGLGSTIMRTGMTEWANVAVDPPIGVEAMSADALMWGNAYSMFLWTFQTFAVFVMAAPALGYLVHVRKKPFMRISEACRSIFGDNFTDGIGGKILDVIFLVSILSGAAVTLGLGTPIVTYNLAEIFNIDITFGLTLIVTVVWVFFFSISAYLGIERGIKKLSTFNMYLGGAFALFIMIAGPGVFILNYFTDSVGFLFTHYTDMILNTNAVHMGEDTHIQSNTVFYFAYNATWAMLHSVFAATVSRGRTIREMIMTYLFAPMLIAWGATAVLGGLGVERYLTGEVPVLDIVQEDAMAAIPAILNSLPLSIIALVAFVVVAMIFMITTLDSTTYTIASYAGTRNMSKSEPSRNLRLIVATIITVFALLLLRIGGLPPLEVVSGLLGIPIIILQFLTIYAAKKMMDEDRAWVNNVRKKKQRKQQPNDK
ncbi:BCCT family transporter [Virgibacillus sp. NKC19-3]|uniref:BCCT family transporter n=1 Tax=Virgibacillus saliphilus TaxID=2831674 RepID=UPI001C9A2EBA|nr:BCCT family transporter [Virgibacillus sp. NKC19-3]MBY7143145.1 BCCT family transporter [Virgibacillus sp. NKC19-3]